MTDQRQQSIGLTGGDGFIAWHLRCAMHVAGLTPPRLATRQTFSSEASLQSFVDGLDVVIHLAGVNRAEDDDTLERQNVEIAESLVAAMEATDSRPRVIYASSTHEASDTPYGRSKRKAGSTLGSWADRTGAPFSCLIIPHVFGECGRPNYNSVVATFCHQLAQGEVPTIQHDGALELVHAQDLADSIIDALNTSPVLETRIEGAPMRVSELLSQLNRFESLASERIIPHLGDPLTLRLFNTWRSARFPDHWPAFPMLHTDDRGALFEGVKTDHGGQAFLSTTRPGIFRGGHYHRFKVERFLVLQGSARIRVRRMFTDSIVSFDVSGDSPCFIDMPTLHTHDIQNTGKDDLLTLFWSHEQFDPDQPDTCMAPVDLQEANRK
ncbi:MAG: NAD-dependent epimerase/dehydratase family protein [Phycisphaerales bacterium]|nr:NAD-dependent epimerase/dehydratase family protein [Phycisphaerales bacterium]